MDAEKQTRPHLPSPWIGHSDREWAFQTRLLLDAILDALDEAKLALKLYHEVNKNYPYSDFRLRSLYAKSFVYALDDASQLVWVLKGDKQLSDTARVQCKRFRIAFPALRDLRNSLHHIEDRLRGIGRDNKPISATLLVISSLRDNNLGATTDKGNYAEIEISEATLLSAFAVIKDLIWCFEWIRPDNSRILPPEADT